MLLGAVLDVSSDLQLSDVLSRIVRSACDMVGAHYGALGVLRPDREGRQIGRASCRERVSVVV